MTGAFARLATAFMESHPAEAAAVIESLAPPVSAAVLGLSRPETAAPILASLSPGAASACLTLLEGEAAATILERLGPDVASRLLRQLDDGTRLGVLLALPARARSSCERLLRFREGTAGSIMEPRLLALPDDVAIEEAMDRLQREAERFHSYVYVVDRGGKLVGVTGIRELVLASSESPLGSVMQPAVSCLSCYAETSEVLAHPGWESLHALPVVDPDGILVGVIRYSTLRKLEREKERRSDAVNLMLTGLALAEFYWITLANALAAATSVVVGSRTSLPSPDLPARSQG